MRTIRWFEVCIVLVGISVLLWSLRPNEKSSSHASSRPSPAASASANVPEPFEPGPWTLSSTWSVPLEHAHGLTSGDIDGDGVAEVLVVRHSSLEILSQDGESKGSIEVDADISQVEVGRGAAGLAFLGYTNWGDEVIAFSAEGKVLWKRPTADGVNGAHWGDLDADGVDEVIIGMNGSGGLLAVDSEGKELWSYSKIGNVWTQAVLSASSEQPARVFATHAGGAVVEFNSDGKFQQQLPNVGYVAPMNAARMAPSGDVQLVVQADVQKLVFFSSTVVLGLDQNGAEIWRLPVKESSSWRTSFASCGDLNGDGVDEWVVPDRKDRLAVMSLDGDRLGTVELPSNLTELTLTPEGLLIVSLEAKTIVAYSLADN